VAGEVPVEVPNRYKPEDVYQRYLALVNDRPEDEFEAEESKRQRFPGHGLEIWGLGYVTSDHSEDNDAEDQESDGDCATNEDLRRKILSYANGQVSFDLEEFETISNNTRLREIYSYRWWQDKDEENYFVMVNKSGKPLLPGQ